MSVQGFSVEELTKQGLQFIKVTLETGENITLVYGESAFEKIGNLTAEGAIWGYDYMPLISCGLGIAGIVLLACPGCISPLLLSSMGFTSGGVKAASIASIIQSWIGNVAKGSAFAMFQSAGAGGAGLGTLNGFVQWAGRILFTNLGACKVLWDSIYGNATTGCWQQGRTIYCHSSTENQ